MAQPGVAGRLAAYFIDSKLTPLLIITSLLLGAFAIVKTPREEEPQIVVPMIDVFVGAPGMTAREVERRVTSPMEQLLWEIPGVEYVYSTSTPGGSMAVVRFLVGEDQQESIVKTYNKLYSHFDRIPPGVSRPLVKPRSIDDVPVLGLTFYADPDGDAGYDSAMLRRVASEVESLLKQIPDVAQTELIGGLRRQLRVELDAERLAHHGLSPLQVLGALEGANRHTSAGRVLDGNQDVLVEVGRFLLDANDVRRVVVAAVQGRPVYVEDVARVVDGSQEPGQYVRFGLGPAAAHVGIGAPGEPGRAATFPAVTLSLSKRQGTNAIEVTEAALERVRSLRGRVIPDGVEVAVTRNYGDTAAHKSNELLFHMGLATVSVILLMLLALGRRESGVVGIAIPVTLGLTLFVFYLYGYTLNRITLFALIFSIGILVDDAIVVVENIVRHYRMPGNRERPLTEIAVEAVDEVGNPTILATLTVIAAILPMAFVGGLMGPYMRPIPVGATAAMVFSLLVAFIITPWASLRLLRRDNGGDHGETEGWTTRAYRSAVTPLVTNSGRRAIFLLTMVGLLLAAVALVGLKLVVVKMLPFDDKSEFQVIVNTPEGTTLESTAAVARELAVLLARVPEVTDYQIYAGVSVPFNFNGLVRHYYLRRGAIVADIQVNLTPRGERDAQSHDIAKRVRPALTAIAARHGARIEVAEVPPGPPVLQTLVAEVYGPNYERQVELARQLVGVFESTEGIVDVDAYIEEQQPRERFVVDVEKAALHGVRPDDVSGTLAIAVGGAGAGLAHQVDEAEDLPIHVQLPLAARNDRARLLALRVPAPGGSVPLGELVTIERTVGERNIYHKNLMPVVYVTADVGGHYEAPVYAILQLGEAIDALELPEGYRVEQLTARLPVDDARLVIKWDGEWHITYEVFRDLGLAFAAVLVLIYVLVVAWFRSFLTPLVIMSAIPFSLVGIMPGHMLMGAFFTATSMIGFIAGAGIVVRNSIILVDFVELRLAQGMPLAEAVVDAGAVRFRPMVLTAAAVFVGASVILFDPIFQGLAVALMAGEIASLLLSRIAVPVLYYAMAARQLASEESS